MGIMLNPDWLWDHWMSVSELHAWAISYEVARIYCYTSRSEPPWMSFNDHMDALNWPGVDRTLVSELNLFGDGFTHHFNQVHVLDVKTN